ncbi:hypothetical protein GUJ93_ZPchr0009g1592 [Zizania palustris]|uniref:Uncharacterized protein n=1 Tax=Zizania palustris TaxID=103762 RepID=A0A8J5V2J6_ZIZPA|nr:hypothetical protein GUJ93_ZPchr0458g22862 [Zizania palustris]KAG8048601.1 hypothetical protein GUJ93_ZPchr0009g1592 [Zizania palustris]
MAWGGRMLVRNTGDHPAELQPDAVAAALLAAVVFLNGEASQLLHLPVPLHVPHIRPSTHLPPGAFPQPAPYAAARLHYTAARTG